jgi:hypothetical protein
MIPRPPLDAFDYWGKLVQLVNGVQAFAARNHLVELRGMNDQRFGESLPLIRTSKVLMYKEFADSLSIHTEHLQKTECKVRLLKAHEEFPIRVWLQATLDRTTRLGGKFSEVCSDAFKVEPGQQKHGFVFAAYPRVSFISVNGNID